MKFFGILNIFLIAFFIVACGDEADSSLKISSGDSKNLDVKNDIKNAESSKDSLKNEDSKNVESMLDSALDSIFLDNSKINLNIPKISLLIFGMNNCGSCKMLQQTIQNSTEIRDALMADYAVYYINLSDEKSYVLGDSSLESSDIKAYFGVIATPTMVFAKDDEILLFIPGYMNEARIIATLKMAKNFAANSQGSKSNVSDNMKALLESFKNQGI